MPNLFSPLKIRSIEFKNRIIVSPMCQYSSKDGFANDWHLVHLGARAVGGAALVITEAAAVSPEGRISPSDLGIWSDEHIPFLKRITTFIEEQGSIAGMQLAHAGRKASHTPPWTGGKVVSEQDGGWQTVAPSALAFSEGEPVPQELSIEEIKTIVNDFKRAAARALKAGFKVIELHAAHGYLVHEFLSPYSNKRTDKYGGSFENRISFLLELIAAVREVWPLELPLFVRISATEWTEGFWTENDSIKLAAILKEKTVDLIDCSTGGNIPHVKIPLVPLYQVPFAEQVKKQSGLLTGAVGLITTPHEANEIIETGKADVVLLARELLRDPYFPLRAAHELNMEISWPKQYERARKKK
ncbi:MAG TPA: NADH:flavin oxidoreductase/NADH oxidase [Bacteroidia bacterium]|jgi:2,4-dienoyl-CoA reductase-like NADH-dependent reductase (Old Yellow Enzyme family)|nr:NADH:flavin oxidoreductase/NADH oxidase [Bacteroidia bacterium]